MPRKIWLHQAAHTDPFNVRRAEWLSTLHRWFDYWLYRIDTGIMREPMADVEVAPTVWRTARVLAGPGHPADPDVPRRRRHRCAAPRPAFGTRESFVDDPTQTAEQLVDNELTARPEPAGVPVGAADPRDPALRHADGDRPGRPGRPRRRT